VSHSYRGQSETQVVRLHMKVLIKVSFYTPEVVRRLTFPKIFALGEPQREPTCLRILPP
jgi:hypothetical protein